jgi:hypothetical protein
MPSVYHEIRKRMQHTIMGMSLEKTQSPAWDQELFDTHHRSMQPGAMAETIERYVGYLEELLDGWVDDCEGKEVDWVESIYELIVGG